MNTLQAITARIADRPLSGVPTIAMPSIGTGPTSAHTQLNLLRFSSATATFEGARTRTGGSQAEKLFDSRAAFKVLTAQIAMHLDGDWRSKLFTQLDSLLDVEQWEVDDAPPSLATFRTLIRALLLLRPSVRPGLGATNDGHLVAAWTTGANRLTLECLPRDQIRWSLARAVNDMQVRAAGLDSVERMKAVLAPYEPQTWFERAK